MRWKTILSTMLCVLVVSALEHGPCAWSNSACAGVLDMPATSSETSRPTASVEAPPSDSVMLASATFSNNLATLLAPETGEELAQAILPKTDLPTTNLLESKKSQASMKLSEDATVTADIAERLAAIEQQRAGFSLNGLFRRSNNDSLFSFFVGMAFVGIVVAGIRLEILRRRAEQAAFYGSELANHHRRHRQRSTVVYVQTPSSRNRTTGQPRRRRRRSSQQNDGQHTRQSRHRDHGSTHPITIESRLAS